MKNILLIIVLLCATGMSQVAWAQKVQTIKIKVAGTCGMCQERIEEASYIKGVKEAKWDKKTHILTVTYNAERTSQEKIERAILATGHDVGNQSASATEYKKLPKCCQYKDGHQCND